MPRNQFERMMFALMTVIVTVHAYVFYSLYVVNGSTLIEPLHIVRTAQKSPYGKLNQGTNWLRNSSGVSFVLS